MEKIPPVASYPDSLDSSPRSRGGESCDDLLPSSSSSSSSRLRLMCSYGGRIVPRPTDKSLCYLGGDTRMVVVDRQSSLADFRSKLSRSLLNNRPFSLKYQLPNEDLDSLISVTTDEDFDNLIDEYDRIAAGNAASGGGSTKASRLRLFLFPSSSSASSSMGSLLDDETKSETWFVDALNSAVVSAGSGSVNSLLGLDDDPSLSSRPAASSAAGSAAPHPIPDSPMLDKTSSFGSTSSAPSLSNLPPIPLPDPKPASFDPAISDPSGRSMYYPDKSSSAGELKQDFPVPAGVDGGYRIPVPVPDSGYIYPHVPQPQYIQHAAGAGTAATNTTFVPTLPTYYQIQPPPPQPQQQQQQQQPQMIFFPYNLPASSPHFPHPNAGKPFPRVPLDPEVQAANMYRTVPTTLAPPPAQFQQTSAAPQYQIPGYHLVHQRPSQPPSMTGNYAYEYADHGRAPMYYSQATSPPSNSEAGQGDGKQNRPS
ncbi:uncharacterized protein [Typha latifolia]|uniref:uncharacterized protein n=1 Tax=Typha latifolia TaxID=4733 RepID=UPI003C2CB1C6